MGNNMPISIPSALKNFGQHIPYAYQQMGVHPVTPFRIQSLIDYILNVYRPLLQELARIIDYHLRFFTHRAEDFARRLSNGMNLRLDPIRDLQNYIQELLDYIGFFEVN
jgi:hypothetical protein